MPTDKREGNGFSLLPRWHGYVAPIVVADTVVLVASLVLAYLLRFEWTIAPQYWAELRFLVPLFLGTRLVLLALFGLYHWSFRHASTPEFASIVKAVLAGTIVFVGLHFFAREVFSPPRSIILIEFLIALFSISAIRFGPRMYFDLSKRAHSRGGARTLVVGAGEAGQMVARQLWSERQSQYTPVGFVDDSPRKQGIRIQQLRVLGYTADIPELVSSHSIDTLVLAMPSAPGEKIRDIISSCAELHVRIKTVPALTELLSEKPSHLEIRDIDPGDLLGREQVEVDETEISRFIAGKRVLVTGAAGSIGSELCRQILRFGPNRLLALDISENGLYYLENELKGGGEKETEFRTVLASVRDRGRMEQVFVEEKPDVVFHAAAHKHVPMMEAHPEEAVKNNVFGSRNVIELCQRYPVESFVLISTDKAVEPSNVMGATKRICELLTATADGDRDARFMAVRFGNVLGSNGSVVPLFLKQIQRGGPVTVTDREVRRFFMTIPEAVRLVLQAAVLGEGGEIFMLRMGEQLKIDTLARQLIIMHGLVPDQDIEVEYTGLRPGEKLEEKLHHDGEAPLPTTHPYVFKLRTNIPQKHDLASALTSLSACLAQSLSREEQAAAIHAIVASLGAQPVPPAHRRDRTPQASNQPRGSDQA